MHACSTIDGLDGMMLRRSEFSELLPEQCKAHPNPPTFHLEMPLGGSKITIPKQNKMKSSSTLHPMTDQSDWVFTDSIGFEFETTTALLTLLFPEESPYTNVGPYNRVSN